MATNKLSKTQEQHVRLFYLEVLGDDTLFPDGPVARGSAAQLCRDLLGYTIMGGVHVSKEKARNYRFGETIDWVDEWDEDTRRAFDDTDTTESTDETDSSVEAEDSEVREAVLSEDV